MEEEQCPKCNTKMDKKYTVWTDDSRDFSTVLYQCPQCKNVEVV